MDFARRQTIKGQCCMHPGQRKDTGSRDTPPAPSWLTIQDMVAVGQGLLHGRISVLQFWKVLLLFLSAWPLTGHAQLRSHPEVVIPLRINSLRKDIMSPRWMPYSLNFGGQRHIIYIKARKFLVSQHFSVFTYTDQGALREDQPFVQRDCYYHGYVEGDQESVVALTTCLGGFLGLLQINNTLYEIKPKSLSSTFEHLVYKVDTEQTQLLPKRCGLTKEQLARQLKLQESDSSMMMQRGNEWWWTHSWYVELMLVIDHNRFLYRRSNASLVEQDVYSILNQVNFFLFPVEVHVALLGLQIWNIRNPMPVEDIFDLLPQFCQWKTVNLNVHIPHDITHLFVQHNYSTYFGLAYVGTVCNPTFGCGVDSLLADDFIAFGHIVAHEIGHNLGMSHDEDNCTCGEGACVMSPSENLSRKFSNCSHAALLNTAVKTSCMRSAPNPLDIFTSEFCGNGVIEQGEDCDCGSFDLCRNDPCCLPGCTLKSGAHCAFGLRCQECQIMSSGTLCRYKANECDLPEWCNGTSHECPEDVFVQDGMPCKNGGYCYEKKCNKHDEQCRRIFGKDAMSANQNCYREMNTRGDRFGNCGINSNEYVRCNDSDILCGRIQCDNITYIPVLRSHYTVHWHHFNGVTCWTIDYHWGMAIPDLGDVKDGTSCGPEHVCMDRICVDKSMWRSDCSPQTCNMKGVCNNKHHCHCDSGWGPPHCLVNGSGGSVDSGPPGKIKKKEEKKHKKPSNSHWSLYLWIPLGSILLCLVLWLYKLEKIAPEEKESNSETLTSFDTE